MFFSCGINSSQASARQLIVQEEAEEEGQLKDPPSQAIRCLSPQQTLNKTQSSAESSDSSRCSSPFVRSEQIKPGKWTHVSSKVSVRPLTSSETASALERQKKRQEKRERRRLRKEAEERVARERAELISGGLDVSLKSLKK